MFSSLNGKECSREDAISSHKKKSRGKKAYLILFCQHFSPSLNQKFSYHPWGSLLSSCGEEEKFD